MAQRVEALAQAGGAVLGVGEASAGGAARDDDRTAGDGELDHAEAALDEAPLQGEAAAQGGLRCCYAGLVVRPDEAVRHAPE